MIYIRADANEHIGTGHVMRCLSVASSFVLMGEDVTFITADHRGDHLISGKGYDTICIDNEWTQMEEELPELIALIKQNKPRMMLVDSYYTTEKYFTSLSEAVPLAYFDDMNACKWDVDYLINYNIFADTLDYTWYKGSKTKLLLGPNYAPLRNEFKGLSPHQNNVQISDVLVSAGGADPEKVTERLIEAVCCKWRDISFHFIVGALNPRIETIKKTKAENAVLHINEQHMSDLMKKCDIAISAAGTTLYEICASGIPTITYTLADNQLIAAEEFEKKNIMLNAGDSRNDERFVERVEACIEQLIEKYELRKGISQRMQDLVDGFGADRIARALIGE